MDVLTGPFQKGCHHRLAGAWSQRLDNLIDSVTDMSRFNAYRPVEHLSSDMDPSVEVATGGEDERQAGISVDLPLRKGKRSCTQPVAGWVDAVAAGGAVAGAARRPRFPRRSRPGSR